MSFVMGLFLKSPLLSLVLGPIVTKAGDQLHQAWSWLDAQQPWVKQLAAVVLSALFVGLIQLIPGAATVPQECVHAIDNGISSACENALASGPFLKAVLTALIAIAVKHGQQNAAKPETPVA